MDVLLVWKNLSVEFCLRLVSVESFNCACGRCSCWSLIIIGELTERVWHRREIKIIIETNLFMVKQRPTGRKSGLKLNLKLKLWVRLISVGFMSNFVGVIRYRHLNWLEVSLGLYWLCYLMTRRLRGRFRTENGASY